MIIIKQLKFSAFTAISNISEYHREGNKEKVSIPALTKFYPRLFLKITWKHGMRENTGVAKRRSGLEDRAGGPLRVPCGGSAGAGG